MGDIIRLDRAQPRVIKGKQPNKNTGTGRHGMDARADELYPTPAPLTLALKRELFLRVNIWEPAAGMGHMAAPLAARGHEVFCSDLIDYEHRVDGSPAIRSPHNFLAATSGPLLPEPYDIVTNPPFAISGDFVRKGLEFTDRVIILNRLAFLEGQARSDIMDNHLDEVLVFVNRPPMMHRWHKNDAGVWVEWTGKKADSAITMAWFIFKRKPTIPGVFKTRRIRWLKSDL